MPLPPRTLPQLAFTRRACAELLGQAVALDPVALLVRGAGYTGISASVVRAMRPPPEPIEPGSFSRAIHLGISANRDRRAARAEQESSASTPSRRAQGVCWIPPLRGGRVGPRCRASPQDVVAFRHDGLVEREEEGRALPDLALRPARPCRSDALHVPPDTRAGTRGRMQSLEGTEDLVVLRLSNPTPLSLTSYTGRSLPVGRRTDAADGDGRELPRLPSRCPGPRNSCGSPAPSAGPIPTRLSFLLDLHPPAPRSPRTQRPARDEDRGGDPGEIQQTRSLAYTPRWPP